MKTAGLVLLNPMIIGLLLGHGLGKAMVAWRLFQSRRINRVFGHLARAFFCQSLFLILAVTATSELPRPRPVSFTWLLIIALTVLAIGDWPLIIYFLKPPKREDTIPPSSGELKPEEWNDRIRRIVREELDEFAAKHLLDKDVADKDSANRL